MAIIPFVVQQHADEAATLQTIRTSLRAAAHVRVHHLRRFDDRLAAHLDGLAVAEDAAWPLCEAALEVTSPGRVFVATFVAVQRRRHEQLERLLALTDAVADARGGMISALGWLEREQLQGTVAAWLSSRYWLKCFMGLGACSTHRVNPGVGSPPYLQNDHPAVRVRSIRLLGELGLRESAASCVAAVTNDEDTDCRVWGSRSAVLLGDRETAFAALTQTGSIDGPHRSRAFRLALQAMPVAAAHALLQTLAKKPAEARWLIQGTGIVGDPTYIPWLINHMADDKFARLAGESFSLITGTDLAWLDLERKPPEDFESGPNDNPEDENVDMDPDEGLPWPDPERVQKWWVAHAHRFQPGQRYFMGAPVTREHCIDVLKNGYQRQRILAAHYLCLLKPGTPLFNTSAPAWRQQRLLATMT